MFCFEINKNHMCIIQQFTIQYEHIEHQTRTFLKRKNYITFNKQLNTEILLNYIQVCKHVQLCYYSFKNA